MSDLAKKLIQKHQTQPQEQQGIEEMPLIHSQNINISLSNIIDNPKNRRMDEDKVNEYAVSIQEIGLIENPVVTPVSEEPGKYMILSGHHRIRACRKLAETDPCYDVVCCKVVNKDEIDAELILLHGNIMHNPLTPYEKMIAIGREEELLKLKQEKGTLRKIIAKNTGLKATQVQTNLTVYKKAIPEVKEALRLGHITLEKARSLAVLTSDEQQRQITQKKEAKSNEVKLLEKAINKLAKMQKAMNDFRFSGLIYYPLNLSDQSDLHKSIDATRRCCNDYLNVLQSALEEFKEAQSLEGPIDCKTCKYNVDMQCSLRVKYGISSTNSKIKPTEIAPQWCPRIKH